MSITFQVTSKTPNEFEFEDTYPMNFANTKEYHKQKCKEIIHSSSTADIYQCSYENGFVSCAWDSYSNEHNLVIRPDDVWISLLNQYNRYTNAHPEESRKFFVTFEGKEALISYNDFVSCRDIDWELFVKYIISQMSTRLVDPDMTKWIIPNFSTTKETDRIAASIIMMSITQHFFTYGIDSSCGIPNVTMLGTVDDWIELKNRVLQFSKYDNGSGLMTKWVDMLNPIMENFVKSV